MLIIQKDVLSWALFWRFSEDGLVKVIAMVSPTSRVNRVVVYNSHQVTERGMVRLRRSTRFSTRIATPRSVEDLLRTSILGGPVFPLL